MVLLHWEAVTYTRLGAEMIELSCDIEIAFWSGICLYDILSYSPFLFSILFLIFGCFPCNGKVLIYRRLVYINQSTQKNIWKKRKNTKSFKNWLQIETIVVAMWEQNIWPWHS